MNLDDVYVNFRMEHPGLACEVDRLHDQYWGEITTETTFLWFESLAKMVNLNMHQNLPTALFESVFESAEKAYLMGDQVVKDCIDVSFVENLFWQVPKHKAEPYWDIFPQLFKDLYVQFHHRVPV